MDEWRELIGRRKRTAKKKRLYIDNQPTNRYSHDGMVGTSLHYEPVEGAGDWQEVDPRIVPSVEPGWDWEMVKSHWRFLVRDGGWFAAEKKGVGIGFRLDRVAYLNIATKDWQTISMASYSTPIVTSVSMDNDLLPNPGGKLTWTDVFPGVGFEICTDGDTLRENVIVSAAARTAMPVLPYPAADTYLVMVYQVDWGQVPGLADDSGDIDPDTNFERDGRLYLKDNLDAIAAALPASEAWAESDPSASVPLRKRFVHVGGNHYLLIGAPVLDLNALPAGGIVFDPTVDEQVGASADDACVGPFDIWGPGAGGTANLRKYCGDYSGELWSDGDRFQGVTIANGSTIDVAYLDYYPYATDNQAVHYHIYGHDTATPLSFAVAAERKIHNRTKTTAFADEDPPADWTDDIRVNSASIVSVVQELEDSYDYSAGAAMVFMRIYQIGGGERLAEAWDTNPAFAAKLHIEYTAGGPPAAVVAINSYRRRRVE